MSNINLQRLPDAANQPINRMGERVPVNIAAKVQRGERKVRCDGCVKEERGKWDAMKGGREKGREKRTLGWRNSCSSHQAKKQWQCSTIGAQIRQQTNNQQTSSASHWRTHTCVHTLHVCIHIRTYTQTYIHTNIHEIQTVIGTYLPGCQFFFGRRFNVGQQTGEGNIHAFDHIG